MKYTVPVYGAVFTSAIISRSVDFPQPPACGLRVDGAALARDARRLISTQVDRTDLDPKQRSHWVKIAKRCNVEVVALRFTATASTCIERAKARASRGEHDGDLNNPSKVAGLVGMLKNRQKQCIISRLARHRRGRLKHSTHWLIARTGQKPIGKGERFDQVLDAYEDDDEKNVALVDALLGRTPSPTKRKAPAAAEPDTQYLDSPGFLPPQEKRRKPSPKDAVVDLTAED